MKEACYYYDSTSPVVGEVKKERSWFECQLN